MSEICKESRLLRSLCLALFVAALGPFQFGFHLAELNAPQSVITCKERKTSKFSATFDKINTLQSLAGGKPSSASASTNRFGLTECISMGVDEFALVTSIFTVGGLLGALIAGSASNKYGRFQSIRLTSICFTLGPLLEAIATFKYNLMLGRFISGFGAGATLVVVPIYISEMAPEGLRGLLGFLTQITINLGILTAQTSGFFLSHGSQWRIILAIPSITGVFQIMATSLVPESPTWLISKGRCDEARHILHYIRHEDENIDAEFRNMVQFGRNSNADEEALLYSDDRQPDKQLREDDQTSLGILSVLTKPCYRTAVLSIVGIMLTQQLTGINSVVMYSVYLLGSLLPTSAAALSVGISLLNLLMTAACAPLPDRIGRKPCLLLSIIGMTFSGSLLAFALGTGLKLLGGIATLTFVASFAVGLGPVPFMLTNELVGLEAVGATQSLALASNWAATFVVSQFFPILNEAMGGEGRIYYIFASVGALATILLALFLPETRGRQIGQDTVDKHHLGRSRLE